MDRITPQPRITNACQPLPRRRRMRPHMALHVLRKSRRYAALREALWIAGGAFGSVLLAYYWLGSAAP